MDLDRWALAFTILSWPEGRKAQLWASLQAGVRPKLDAESEADLNGLDPARLRQQAEARGARLWLPSDIDAAPLLSELPYPVALWARGSLPPSMLAVALVGSREPSPLGRARARSWAGELTKAGVAVLSGLARGIDGAAHLGALEVGPTWGVMGSGLDHPYPPEHLMLMDRMVAAGGGVITPFPPDAKPQKWHFPRRNWLLAAWTQGVVVLEAKLKSGSLVTARLALDLGRELWACPGAPENPLSEGPNSLLREGAARICRSSADILEDLQSLPLGINRP
ncbi:MAG: DNA-protecting protein DprA [Holophaga sp.]|nr:DNA-protecting protein DprA [Holophaga sp.]